MRGTPVVMDGEVEFEAISDAARFLCERDGIDMDFAKSMVANIANVIGKVGKKGKPLTAYGHVWTELEDDARTAAYGYENRIEALESIALDLWSMSKCLHSGSEWLDMLERMRELGLEV